MTAAHPAEIGERRAKCGIDSHAAAPEISRVKIFRFLAVSALFAAASLPPCAPGGEPAALKTVQVIDFTKLLPLLPEPPAGWKADKPEGSTTESEGFSLTTAGRTYTQGDAEDAPNVTVNILDSASNKEFSAATMAEWNVAQETPEGYTKPLVLDGNKGFEQWTNEGQLGNLWVMVGGRFFVQIETTRLPATEMQAWLKRLDLKKLAALK